MTRGLLQVLQRWGTDGFWLISENVGSEVRSRPQHRAFKRVAKCFKKIFESKKHACVQDAWLTRRTQANHGQQGPDR